MARRGTPRPIADVGSAAGALAVTADGSLYLGDGPRLWKLAIPTASDAAPATARPPAAPAPSPPPAAPEKGRARPELIAEGLGDVYGVAIAADGRLIVSDWEGGRVLAIAAAADATGAKPRAAVEELARGLEFPSGVVALPDGVVIVKESGRQKNVPARLSRIERDGTMKRWLELRRDDWR